MALFPAKPARGPAPRKKPQPHPGHEKGIDRGDHVYVRHPEHGPMAMKVLAHGRDGLTGECSEGQRHRITWDRFLGHKARMLHRYTLADQGADGALLEDDRGRRRYVQGQVPVAEEKPPPAPAKDDPLAGGLGRLKKAEGLEEPRTLYIHRPVLNGHDIVAWYQAQGCTDLAAPNDMHITIAHSETPLRWDMIPAASDGLMLSMWAAKGHEALGKDGEAKVLSVEAPELVDRWKELRKLGASWKWPSYKPHVTLSWGGKGFDRAIPWPGPIELGPEVFGQVIEAWRPKMAKAMNLGAIMGPVLFVKAQGQGVANRPGLALQDVTDKAGHQTKRWKRTGPEEKHQRPMAHGDVVGFQHGEVQGHGKVVASGQDGVTLEGHDGQRHQVKHEHLTGHAPAEHKALYGEGGGGGQPVQRQQPKVGRMHGVEASQDSPDSQNAKLRARMAEPDHEMELEGRGADPHPHAPENFSAAAFFAEHNDHEATPEKILAQFPPDTADKIAEVERQLAGVKQTIELHRGEDGTYTPERQELHKKIIEHFLSPERVKAATPGPGEKPSFTILGGRGGSGKSWFEGNVFHPDKAIVLDADHIKSMLPEYAGWNAAQVHEESGDLFDHITAAAHKAGLNIVHDATMKTTKKAVALVQHFKDSGYRVEAHYMHLPRQIAAQRAVARFLGKTRRYVPPAVVLSNTSNEASFDAVKPLVDAWSFRDNNVPQGQPPRLISEKKHEGDAGERGRDGREAPARPAAGDARPGAPGKGQGNGGGGFPPGHQGHYGPARGPAHSMMGKALAAGRVLFLKAAIPGGAAGDLFAMPAEVKGHVRGGSYVAPYQSTRKRRARKPTEGDSAYWRERSAPSQRTYRDWLAEGETAERLPNETREEMLHALAAGDPRMGVKVGMTLPRAEAAFTGPALRRLARDGMVEVNMRLGHVTVAAGGRKFLEDLKRLEDGIMDAQLGRRAPVVPGGLPDQGSAKVPGNVASTVKVALNTLKGVADAVRNTASFDGEKLARELLAKEMPRVASAKDKLARFADIAKRQGVDADAFLREHGGEADVHAAIAEGLAEAEKRRNAYAAARGLTPTADEKGGAQGMAEGQEAPPPAGRTHVRVEMDRGNGWEVRQEGHTSVTADEAAAQLPHYTLTYPHRVFLDGKLVASSERRRNGRVVVKRHDG